LARAGGKTGDEAGQQRSGASGRARLSTHTPLPDPIHGYTSAPPCAAAEKFHPRSSPADNLGDAGLSR
jgi:hypothetical protein